MGIQVAFLVVGLVSLLWPQLLAPLSRREHVKRLEALKAGAQEAYFEERRALETYPLSRTSLLWRRTLGGVMVLTSIGLLVWDHLPLN
ncbi:MAG: hypothetical protein JWR59_122 [Brevundimonas sp.]|nr:hypothetical protein [Brevundimonas sp.]